MFHWRILSMLDGKGAVATGCAYFRGFPLSNHFFPQDAKLCQVTKVFGDDNRAELWFRARLVVREISVPIFILKKLYLVWGRGDIWRFPIAVSPLLDEAEVAATRFDSALLSRRIEGLAADPTQLMSMKLLTEGMYLFYYWCVCQCHSNGGFNSLCVSFHVFLGVFCNV